MPTPKAGYFLKDGITKVPGTTTICSAYKDSGGLIHWAWNQGKQGLDYRETRDKAGDIGTLVHAAIEAYIGGTPLPVLDEVSERAYQAFLRWEGQNKILFIEQEIQLVSEEYEYGGTLDAVGIADGEHILLDWKTAKGLYKNHVLQLAAYAQLWNENYPEEPIERAWLLRFSKTDGVCEPYFFTAEDLMSYALKQFLAFREAYGWEDLVDRVLEKAKSCMKPL